MSQQESLLQLLNSFRVSNIAKQLAAVEVTLDSG